MSPEKGFRPSDGQDIDSFYTSLFTKNPNWSTPFANVDEARRSAIICNFLSQIAQTDGLSRRFRLLDVGCGRGWLTKLVSVYGRCDGLDPVRGPIELARKYFPELTFFQRSLGDLVRSETFEPYDIVIASEVIEHIVDKDEFVDHLATCIIPGGHLIITTPRGEEFQKYRRLGWEMQPIEAWLSERELRLLFARHGFEAIQHDRAYVDLPSMSLLHRLSASRRISHLGDRLRLRWLHKGLQFVGAIYQAWWFRLGRRGRDE